MSDAKDELIEALISQLQLMNEDLSSACGMAYVHGWRSPNVDKGKANRIRIRSAYHRVYGGGDPKWLFVKDLDDDAEPSNPLPPSF